MSRGSLFQKVGPETRNLRGPKVAVFVRGMIKSPRAADQRVERPYTSDTRANISTREAKLAAMDDDDDMGLPTRLSHGIDLNDLREGKGTEFETEEPDFDDEEDLQQFEPVDIYKYYQENDDKYDDIEDRLMGFEEMSKKMVNVLPNGSVKKQVLKEGTGDVVPEKSSVTVHYNAYLDLANEPFDSTRLRASPQSFDLGFGQVVEGFEIAVLTMRKGELSRFLIEPELGYGEQGCPPRIPGGSSLLYVVELLNIVDTGGAGEYFNMPMSERADAPYEVMIKAVKKLRMEAKDHFKNAKYHIAGKTYEKARKILESYHMKDEEEEKNQQRVILGIYQNLALCHLKLKQLGQVIHFANEALYIDPACTKALYFKGKALRMYGEFARAKETLLKAQKLRPDNKEIREELAILDQKSNIFHMDEREMYKRMFSQSNKTSSEVPKGASQDAPHDVPKDAPKVEGVPTAVKVTESGDNQNEELHDKVFKKSDEELSQMFEETLNLFVNDPEMMEFPFSSSNYSTDELDTLEHMARKMNLEVIRKEEGAGIVNLRIFKN